MIDEKKIKKKKKKKKKKKRSSKNNTEDVHAWSSEAQKIRNKENNTMSYIYTVLGFK